ncbi:GMC family oxidoreductase [Rhodococcus spelaei]|uniref:Cholesterol oxidase n=1 Tax=Rhodococcus spelaei TaxID=2546320 RepID=A0A541BAL8_9NOCA|nr:GMC oxidoreductase [Rhodococcus spelaei]TQF69376.1 GMC family oxidoreductase [Rhodococcus spelaei]
MDSPRLSRRTVLRGAALGLGAAALGPLATHTAAAQAAPPGGRTAIVIGSGFAGAVSALRLGLAGIETTVVERGRRWPIDPAGNTFATLDAPDGRSAWFSDRPYINPLTQFQPIQRYAGVVDQVNGNGINAVYGAGVGGGSLVFGAYTPQPRRQDFEQIFPRQIDYGELDRVYYPRARAMLGTSPLPADLLANPKYVGARSWLADVADFGGTPTFHDFCVDWDLVRAELAGTRRPSVTVGEGPYGINSGAKNSVDHNYLPRAEATGNVTVLPLHEVIEMREVEGGTKFEVTARHIDEYGTVLETKRLVADYLFVAAGSFHTSALMVTAKAKGWLPRLNEHAGKGFGNNGDFLISRTLTHREYGSKQAGPGVALLYDDEFPDGPISMSWQAAPFPDIAGGNTSTNLIQAITRDRGSIDYNVATGQAELNYPFGEGSDLDTRARRFAGTFHDRADVAHGFPANGIPVYTRLAGFGSASTYHGLGGMVMGKACDYEGRVEGYENLYVVDGALIPGSVGLVNPSLTITAIAERCLDHFLAGVGGG